MMPEERRSYIPEPSGNWFAFVDATDERDAETQAQRIAAEDGDTIILITDITGSR